MAQRKIITGKPKQYGDCLIVPTVRGYDVVHKNYWYVAQTERQAKWWISVNQNLTNKCMRHDAWSRV